MKRQKLPMRQAKAEDQIKSFRKAARELGCDDDETRFQEALRTVAKAKPHPQEPKKRPINDN